MSRQARRSKAEPEQAPEAEAEHGAAPVPLPLPPHPKLAGYALEEVLVQIVPDGEHYRLGIDTGILSVWQRPYIRERAAKVRQLILERNVERFVTLHGPDPVFTHVEHLEGL